ncbi:MAG: dienelactone hydrolase family protein [Planctomycetes bacterium]|nr:dienelactone hydrolase family protein [Planctomycetota bacterium]
MTTSWLAPCALLLVAALVFVAPTARGEDPVAVDDHGEAITYRHGDVELQGWLQRPEGADSGARLPAVLVCHAWRGHGEFVRKVAQRLARDGYVAFALDMYGKGVYAKDNAEAAKLAGPFYTDAALIRGRARAGLEVLRNRPEVDPARIGAVGFCFGGTTVLELSRDGAPLAAAVSFHGGLKTNAPAETGAVKTRLLVCHGGDDPYVPAEDVMALWKELRAAQVDHQILVLSGAVHAFTDTEAGDDPSQGAAYNAVAAHRAWDAADRFLAEALDD